MSRMFMAQEIAAGPGSISALMVPQRLGTIAGAL